MHDDLGIRLGLESVSASLETRAELTEVVDLSVEHRVNRAVLVRNRLRAGRQVDDAEATHAECCLRIDVVALVVGSTMAQGGRHPEHDGAGVSSPAGGHKPGDATHFTLSLSSP